MRRIMEFFYMKEYNFSVSAFRKLKLFLFNGDYRAACLGLNEARKMWSIANDKENTLKKIRLVVNESEYEVFYSSLEAEMDKQSELWELNSDIKAEIEFSGRMSAENRKKLNGLTDQKSKNELESI